ncbi:MAG: SdrD B-like domain-containing protein [Acidimicrobiia bacterium]
MGRYGRAALATAVLASGSIVVLGGAVVVGAAGAEGGAITGTVFRDSNVDGVFDAGEVGTAGVTVEAFDADGDPVGTATSLADGTFTLTVAGAATTAIRVEFSGLPAYLRSGPLGPDSGSSVQFATLGDTGVDFGVTNPAEFCQENPTLATNCFSAGPNDRPDVVTRLVPYNASGIDPSLQTGISDAIGVGSVYGVAYQRSTGRVFLSSFLKRHAGVGPGGLSAIYRIDGAASGTPSAPVAQLPAGVNTDPGGLVPSNAVRNLNEAAPGTLGFPSTDPAVFPLVMKVGYGDLDMGEDDQTLWTTNLATRQVVRIPVNADGSFGTPQNFDPPAAAACPGGVARPFGLDPHDGKIYVGFVCTAEVSGAFADLSAHVFALDPVAGTWSASVIDIPLTYPKGLVFSTIPASEPWYAWTDSFVDAGGNPNFLSVGDDAEWLVEFARPMPIVADLAFDRDGSLIIGFGDRTGHMLGHRNLNPLTSGPDAGKGGTVGAGGDLLRAAPPTAPGGQYRLEGNGTLANGLTSASGVGNGQGPADAAGTAGEFYSEDSCCPGTMFHEETATGGVLQLEAKDEVAAVVYSPIRFDSAGFDWFSNTDGSEARSYEIFYDPGSPAPSTFGKSNGLADLEAFCDRAPVEIGNRVWLDTDNDGVQDADEAPLPGVTVSLYLDADANGVPDGPAIATAITDDAGNYVFSGDQRATRTSTDAFRYQIAELVPGATLIVGVPTSVASGGSTYALTGANVGADQRDSDALPATGFSATVTIGAPGENDHTWDMGYATPGYDLALIKTIASPTGPVALNGDVTWTITVTNQGGLPSGDFVVQDTIPTGMSFVSASDGGTEAAGIVTWNLTGLDPGASRALTLVTKAVDVTKAPFRNWAEITSDSGDDDDSTPDTNTGKDSTNPNDQVTNHNDTTFDSNTATPLPGGQLDEDDNDLEEIDVVGRYDLALIKTLPAGQTVISGGTINWELTVINQGNVDSGLITVQDAIPTGMAFVSASDGGTATGDTVTWTITNLAPGAKKVLTLATRVTDISRPAYRNWAEITADSGDDIDSTPDTNLGKDSTNPNDQVTNHNDTTFNNNSLTPLPGGQLDEDDNDYEEIPNNSASAAPGTTTTTTRPRVLSSSQLPSTGSDIGTPLQVAAVAIVGGLLLLGFRRRMRRTRTT